jgi:peptidoglycan/LPS O-acetylase OafA/YrhL
MLDTLLGFAVMLGVPAYVALQIWVPRRARGRWRWAAFAPLLCAIPLILFSLYALSQGSNLWPLGFVLFAPLGAGFLLLVMAARALWDRPAW